MASSHYQAHPASTSTSTFEYIFKEYYARLCFFAERIVKNQQVAEDVVQDCFLKVWERIDSIQPAALPAYLYTSVQHAAVHHIQKHKNLGPLEIEVTQEDISHHIIIAETNAAIFKAFQQLPPKCHEIFELLYKKGKNYRQIAKQLHITESTVRNQKAKGIFLIRQRLQKFLGLFFLFL